MQQFNHPNSNISTGAYSPALQCGQWLYVSGQGPLDMSSGKIISQDIAGETKRTLANIETLLKQAGATRRDVVKCTCYLANIEDFDKFNKAYGEFFKDSPRPARTTIGASLPGIKIEIDAIALIPNLTD